MTIFYIVRHGESEYNAMDNPDEYIPGMFGENGAHLTKKGKKQAEERAEHLKHIHFDAIFASDLMRAKQTAEIIKLERQLAIETNEVLRENRHYIPPGKTLSESEKEIQEILKKLDEKAKMAYKPDKDFESSDETASRMLTFLREIAVGYKNKTVLVVNHGNNMRSLLRHLGYAKFDGLPHGAIENTGYIIIESDGIDFFLKDMYGIHIQK